MDIDKSSDLLKINRDITLLAPFVKDNLLKGISECAKMGFDVRLFEGWRSANRQTDLYALGRYGDKDHKIVTYADAWHSWHNVGAAADLAGWNQDNWTWDMPWPKIMTVFEDMGFERLKFEQCHIQMRGGLDIGYAVDYMRKRGISALWELMEEHYA